MSKRKLFGAMLGIVSIAALASCKDNKPVTNEVDDVNTSNSQKLQILNTGAKLTQEQRLSQIKADYLLQNNGYKDDDTVTVILSLDEDSIVSRYSKDMSNKYESVNDYINSIEGQSYNTRLEIAQNNLIKKLKTSNLISNVLYRYTTVTNGIAVEMLYKNLEKVEGMTSIKYASLSETYNQVKEATTSTSGYSVVENLVDVYKSTGIFNSSSVEYTGEGTAVAVLDSGFDVSHEVFSKQPETELINMSSLESVIGNLNAAKTSEGLTPTDVYYSKKIPFMYDYADNDPDVAPFDSSHGTHVAGIIGGSSDHITDETTGETFTGVAVNTQLVLMKVFGDKDNGAETEDILAGLEDSIILGVDCINMSLGTTCGFSREEDEKHINEVYDSIAAAGITCLAAASNDYSSGMNGPTGNTSLVTHPDSGTIGSPGSYDSTLTVASISGVKSGFVIGNDSQVFFFNESNQIDGTSNNFIKELYELLTKTGQISKMDSEGNITLDYVTVPGIGANINYVNCNVEGKIALVRRGSNTFEEKASIAKAYGAIACIIYNNVDGDITMSMGKTGHIPTVSISKDDGTILASKDSGTMTFNVKNQAGPFMSDFSSWGPTPDLKLKPEITGHGGKIVSAIPGGGYEEMSGTSMATPNLCGVTVLIRQYLKEKYPGITAVELNKLANQLLMSTATIAKDENGNSYSPRKQGAGLASLKKATTSNALISIDGSDKSKLELGDDAKKTGVYTMKFNVKNLSEHSIDYKLEVDAITERVSTSDYTHLAEKAQNLNGKTTIDSIIGGTINDDVITVPSNGNVTVTLTYTLSDEDKKMMDASFPYGIYVEGFVKLIALDTEKEIDLNVPFLAFYGDWTQAPILDKTFYEVESEAYNDAIDAEDKIAADYIATTPFASYLYSYIISLGTYIYDIPEGYDKIPASEDKIAISDGEGTLDGISAVYAGLLRGCKEIDFTITDNVTGEVIYSLTDYNGRKSATSGGVKTPYIYYFKLKSANLNLVNNRKYTFNMDCKLDYGDGGVNTNIRNNFSYEFTFDNEAPIIKDASYEIVYDKALKKNRYYMLLDIYDNHYVQCITPLSFTSESSYSILSPNPIPVYGERGTTNKVRFEITEYLKDMANDALIGTAIPIQVTDYALNTNIFLCQFPGTKGDFKFTEDGTASAKEKTIQRVYVGEYMDLTQFLYSKDQKDTNDKAYFELLNWEVEDGYKDICKIENGVVVGLKKGKAWIKVSEGLYGSSARIQIDVRERTLSASKDISLCSASATYSSSGIVEDAVIEDLRFSSFTTIYAHAECSERSIIGRTGDIVYVNSLMNGLSFYPGEEIKLNFDFYPWYAKDNYEFTWNSTNPNVASVDQEGNVKGLKKGTTTITLGVNGSNIKARINVTINSEFVIEDKVLVAYKGLGGDVVIPDDEGLINIGPYAFSLYTVDKEMYVDEKDYDANKIPSSNNTITSITIPKGITDIQKYAFYNCKALKKVTFLDKIKNIYEYAFANCTALEDINLENVSVIGKYTFANCTSLKTVDLSNIYAIGMNCFEGATALEYADLTSLRNNGENSFKDTTSLKRIVTNKDTKLSFGMFENSGLESLELYVDRIPAECFKNCINLASVTFNNALVYVGESAFSGNTSLTNIEFKQSVREIKTSTFENCSSLTTLDLPNSNVVLGDKAFSGCTLLTTVNFKDNTLLSSIGCNVFNYTAITSFNLGNNTNYVYENNLLLNTSKNEIVFANSNISGSYTIPATVEVLGPSSFSACSELEDVVVNHNLSIGNGAFAGLNNLNKLQLLDNIEVYVGKNAFNGSKLSVIENATSISSIGEAAFMDTKITEIVLADGLEIASKAFSQTKLVRVTLGKNVTIGSYSFYNNQDLVDVNMPADGGVTIGSYAFYNNQYLQTIDLTKAISIGDNSFNNCIALLAVSVVAEEIGDYAFANCKSLNSVTLSNTKTIGDYAFALTNKDDISRAPSITTITLPNTLEYIGDYAFNSCSYLTSVEMPLSVEYVGSYAFANCSSLQSVVLPIDLEEIKEFTFYNCTKLESINLGKIITIKMGAFLDCTSLVNVDLGCVEEVGIGAFQNAKLTNLNNTSNIINIGSYAFSGNLFTSFDASSVESIGEGAFMNAVNLDSFTFYRDIKRISPSAFYGASKLKAFYALESTKNGKINDYAFVENGVLYTYLPNGKQVLSSVPAALDISTLVVKENTYRVEAFAGNANKNIVNIELPDGLKTIGDAAFYNYSKLKKVTFNTSTAPVLENKYDSELKLSSNHPGYKVLNNVYSFFDIIYSYKNFKALAGALSAITMVLPSNEELLGYDALVYQLYFGDYKTASRTTYEAMDKNTVEFLDNIVLVPNINDLVFRDQSVVLNALTSYNKVKQDLTKYGYSEEEITAMVSNLLLCKDKIQELKLSYASTNVQNIQKKINELGSTFSIDKLKELYELNNQISNLSRDDKEILDLTSYNLLKESYDEYRNQVKIEGNEAEQIANNVFKVAVITALTTTVAVALAVVISKKYI